MSKWLDSTRVIKFSDLLQLWFIQIDFIWKCQMCLENPTHSEIVKWQFRTTIGFLGIKGCLWSSQCTEQCSWIFWQFHMGNMSFKILNTADSELRLTGYWKVQPMQPIGQQNHQGHGLIKIECSRVRNVTRVLKLSSITTKSMFATSLYVHALIGKTLRTVIGHTSTGNMCIGLHLLKKICIRQQEPVSNH